ncbi:MAG: uroporphyrinogen-III C-methyltransferase [Sedimentisphaerales bacterium]|nr:uroporphyrinogen-III C-methyltransferase [Sedimentisphaerales bacterium]
MQGKVYLVGAGPGDPGLITVRGRELLGQAQVVIYDYLAAPQLLAHAGREAELIYVGKRAGQHTLAQDQIGQLMVQKAREGKTVVRLKGGDPFVFGRGGEEAQQLAEAGIRFEVVPGVTAGVAAAAYAGIPVTHRDLASDFALISGQEDADRTGESHIDWEALGRWKGTLAFYMGVKNLPVICTSLQENGMDPATPAALIGWGTTPRQRTLTGTVSTLAELAEAHRFKPPALILIGQVVTLRQRLNWFETRPLFGRTILVTRSRAQAGELTEQLGRLGAEVIECPTIRIEPPANPKALRQVVERLGEYDWLILTSVNGVEAVLGELQRLGRDGRHLAGTRLCAIGPATARRLRCYGLLADLVPEQFVAESILEAFARLKELPGKRICLARADIARDDLPRGLRRLGAEVDEVTAYRTLREEWDQTETLARLADNQVDWITFASSGTVRNFLDIIGLEKITGKKARIASIGPITSATIQEAGLRVDVQADEYTIPGLVRAICRAEGKTDNAAEM